MKLKNITHEELEVMSYTDITYMLLKEHKQPMSTPVMFHQICDMLEYGESAYEDKIGDYYTSLTIDRRFVLLDNAEWGLREHYQVHEELDDDEELDDVLVQEDESIDVVTDIDDDEEVDDEEIEDDLDTVLEDDLDDDEEDELSDLTIITDEEIE